MNKHETYLKNWNNNSSLKNVSVKNKNNYHPVVPKFNIKKETLITTQTLNSCNGRCPKHISPCAPSSTVKRAQAVLPWHFPGRQWHDQQFKCHISPFLLWETQSPHTISYLPFGISSSICNLRPNETEIEILAHGWFVTWLFFSVWNEVPWFLLSD